MEYEFHAPSFVQENEPDIVHNEMLHSFPQDLDTMPGGFMWDLTRPAALMKSELIQFHLVQTLKLMFPQFAWDEWLDLHGEQSIGKRKAAGYARGTLKVTGVPDTIIPKGFIFLTVSDYQKSFEFSTDEECKISETGEIEIPITAVEDGIGSNVPAKTITLMAKPIKGVISIYNEKEVTGGTEKESDEDYLDRIMESNAADKDSFIGNNSDYERWAKAVVGVGAAKAIANWNGASTVKLVIVDSNGQPANEYILQEVYNAIMSPEDEIKQKAPIGAILTVTAPNIISIVYSFSLIVVDGFEKINVIESFKQNLLQYYTKGRSEGVLKYTELYTVLRGTEGVDDFADFLVNGNKNNILLQEDEYPETAEVIV